MRPGAQCSSMATAGAVHVLASLLWVAMVAAPAHAQDCSPNRRDFFGSGPDENFGRSVSGAGDVNGDGFDDIVVGAYNDATPGSARVISGADGSTLYTFSGDSNGDSFGVSVSGAGDVNNDGFDDIVVGAEEDDDNGTDCGSARVFSGVDGSILYTIHGSAAFDYFGGAVAGAGDVNGDGHGDLIVGAVGADPSGSFSGSATVLSGVDGSVLYTFNGDKEGIVFGVSVSGAGDVNSDGRDDLVVGAECDFVNGPCAGSVSVFSGIDGSILYVFHGDGAFHLLGNSVSGAGDVDNDGHDDIVAGAVGSDTNGALSGSVRVFSGMNGAILYTVHGESLGDHLGCSVSGVGDVDGDGLDDIVAGAEGEDDNGNASGSARVLSGLDGSTLYEFHGDGAVDSFGFSVSGAGDVNSDGFPDIAVGAYRDDDNGDNSGSARLLELSSAITSSEYCTASNEASISLGGCSMASAMLVHLHANPVYQAKVGYLCIGNGSAAIAPPGTVGELCLGGGTLLSRYIKDVVSIDANGDAFTSISDSVSGGAGFGIPNSGGQSIQPGDTWNFAYWYRRGSGESGFSSALAITFQ